MSRLLSYTILTCIPHLAREDDPRQSQGPERPAQSVVERAERPGGQIQCCVDTVDQQDVGEVETVQHPDGGGSGKCPAKHNRELGKFN